MSSAPKFYTSCVIEWKVEEWQLYETHQEREEGLLDPLGGWRAENLHPIIEAIDKLCLCPRWKLCKYCKGSTNNCLVRIGVHSDKEGIIDKDIGGCIGCKHRDAYDTGYHEMHNVVPFTSYRYLTCTNIYTGMVQNHKTFGSFNRRRWIFGVDVFFPDLYLSTCDFPNTYVCTT